VVADHQGGGHQGRIDVKCNAGDIRSALDREAAQLGNLLAPLKANAPNRAATPWWLTGQDGIPLLQDATCA